MPQFNLSAEQQKMLEEADAAIAEFSANYVPFLKKELTRLNTHIKADFYEDALQIIHTIQGQAGSFGWPLITEGAGHLYALLKRGKMSYAVAEPATAITALLGEMLDQNLQGETPKGKAIVSEIAKLAKTELK